MFSIHSSDFTIDGNDVYSVTNEFLNFENNDLSLSGITTVITKSKHWSGQWIDSVVVIFTKPIHKHLHAAIVEALHEAECAFDKLCEQHELQSARQFLEKEIESKWEDACEMEWRSEMNRLSDLYNKVVAGRLTLDEIEEIIKAEIPTPEPAPAMHEWTAEVCYNNAKELLESLGGSVTFVPNKNRAIGSDYHGWFKIMVPESVVSKFKIDHRYPGSFMLNNQ